MTTKMSDSILGALRSIDAWLAANPNDSPQRSQVYGARKRLSQALDTIEGQDLDAALAGLGADVPALQACVTRLTAVSRTIDTAQAIVNDVGKVVAVLTNVATALVAL
jgi:hypothetical protein